MAETGEKYTVARRMVIAGHDPGQPPVILRVYLNPYVDLKLTAQAGREYAGAGQRRQRDMSDRLLADRIEVAGFEEAKIAASAEIMTDQELRAEDDSAEDAAIRGAVRQGVERAAASHWLCASCRYLTSPFLVFRTDVFTYITLEVTRKCQSVIHTSR